MDQLVVLMVLGNLQCLPLSELKKVSINSSHKCHNNLFDELSISYQLILECTVKLSYLLKYLVVCLQ